MVEISSKDPMPEVENVKIRPTSDDKVGAVKHKSSQNVALVMEGITDKEKEDDNPLSIHKMMDRINSPISSKPAPESK